MPITVADVDQVRSYCVPLLSYVFHYMLHVSAYEGQETFEGQGFGSFRPVKVALS